MILSMEEATRENVSWIIVRKNPENLDNFNYLWDLVQNLTPGLACQEFVPELGSASQCHGTKVDHEMSSKYWSNSLPRGKNLRNEISNCSPPM